MPATSYASIAVKLRWSEVYRQDEMPETAAKIVKSALADAERLASSAAGGAA
jgi:hypothetical protein